MKLISLDYPALMTLLMGGEIWERRVFVRRLFFPLLSSFLLLGLTARWFDSNWHFFRQQERFSFRFFPLLSSAFRSFLGFFISLLFHHGHLFFFSTPQQTTAAIGLIDMEWQWRGRRRPRGDSGIMEAGIDGTWKGGKWLLGLIFFFSPDWPGGLSFTRNLWQREMVSTD